ncbi:MAG: hypothetical protein PHU37_08475 [Methanoculleus chikugoensis]|nr:hypothetical protein [Methanoculleus chikugoensis]
MLSKFTVTFAPAGTVMVLVSKARFSAERSTVAISPSDAVFAAVVSVAAGVPVSAGVVIVPVGVGWVPSPPGAVHPAASCRRSR